MEPLPKRQRVWDPDLMWTLRDDPNWVLDEDEDTQSFVYIGHEIARESVVVVESGSGDVVATGSSASHDAEHHVDSSHAAETETDVAAPATVTPATSSSGHDRPQAGPSGGSSSGQVHLEPQ